MMNDVDALNHIQEAYPRSKSKWQTVVGDMSKSDFNFDQVKKMVHLLNGKVKAINWNP